MPALCNVAVNQLRVFRANRAGYLGLGAARVSPDLVVRKRGVAGLDEPRRFWVLFVLTHVPDHVPCLGAVEQDLHDVAHARLGEFLRASWISSAHAFSPSCLVTYSSIHRA